MRTVRCFMGLLASTLLILTSYGQTADLLGTRSVDQIQGLASGIGVPNGVLPFDFGVAKYRVTYPMQYLGQTYQVTGAMFVPLDGDGDAAACAMPTHTYMHGTMFVREAGPSYEGFEGELGYLMATGGALTLMPDYLGLGGSEDVLHPYVHADSEAESGIAFLQAVLGLQDELGIGLNGQHFVSGYSQGGHASMAMAKRMQEDPDAGFPLAGAAPMSGPYDMSGTQLPMGMAQEQYSNPAYLAYTLLAWQQTYGNLFVDLGEIFQEPYASGLTAMFDGETEGSMINDYLAGPTADIVQPGALEGLMAEDHPFFLAAQDNDLYQWVPESPVQMYYCTLDEQVFYENALVAEAWMNDNGASAVIAIDGGPLNHGGCALLAILGGTVWINNQADLCETSGLEGIGRRDLSWQPAAGGVSIDGLKAGEAWTLFGLNGRILKQGYAPEGQMSLAVNAGLFVLRGAESGVIRIAVAE
jgi:hypothetical protein